MRFPDCLMPRDENCKRAEIDKDRAFSAMCSIAAKRTRFIIVQGYNADASLSTLLAAAYMQGMMDAAISISEK